MEKMFELATRSKLRFAYKGVLSVEDLWDLKPTDLDAIYKQLNTQLKQAQEESLLKIKSPADKELELKIEIVKHIVSTKLAEQEAALNRKKNAVEKQKILDALAARQEQNLQNMSEEELKAKLAALDEA